MTSEFAELGLRLEHWAGHAAWQRVIAQESAAEVYLAGGAVRDAVTRRSGPSSDFDFFVRSSDLDRVIDRLGEAGTLSHSPFGAPRWFPSGDSSHYADIIPIERFRNGLWPCEDITDALNQFDMTANAVAFCLRSGRIFDPQNGLRDARRRIVRAVRFDYPDEPFVEGGDLSRLSVLWCRLVHYAGMLGFGLDPITREWLRANRRYRADVEAFGALFHAVHPGALDAF